MSIHRRALLVTTPSTAPGRRIVASACRHLVNAGWTYRLASWSQEYYLDILREVDPDVLLVLPGGTDQQNASLARERPTVAVNIRIPGCTSVLPDEWAIGRLAAQHFLERGLTNLACIAYHHDWSLQRSAGFLERARQANARTFVFDGDPFTIQRLEPEGFYCNLPLRNFLLSLPKPSGLLVPCDHWALHVLQHAHFARLRVPEDLAVLGVDDDDFVCELAVPPLSSIAIPWELMGQQAALCAIGLVTPPHDNTCQLDETTWTPLHSAPTPQVITLPPAGVSARRSSDAIAVSDPEVHAALRVIHDHADKPLTVSRVLKLVPSHQHRLEKLFRKHVGRTMIAEIRRVHVQHAVKLLSSTTLTIQEISTRSGFATPKLLTQALRKEYGLSPSQFRKNLTPTPQPPPTPNR